MIKFFLFQYQIFKIIPKKGRNRKPLFKVLPDLSLKFYFSVKMAIIAKMQNIPFFSEKIEVLQEKFRSAYEKNNN